MQAAAIAPFSHNPLRRRAVLLAVAVVHGVVLSWLPQLDRLRVVADEVAPLLVTLMATEPPPDQAPPLRLTVAAAPTPPLVQPPLPVVETVAEVSTVDTVRVAPPPPAPTVAEGPAPQPTLAAPAAARPTPPPRRQIAANAVRYLVEPPVETPRASRRAREHGVVWLRVVVSVHGLPVQVTVARSSGYARLDEQAVAAMRSARFKPHTVDGAAVEVEVIAPIEYPEE